MIFQYCLLLPLMDQLHTDAILADASTVKVARIIFMKIKHYAKNVIQQEIAKLGNGY